MRQIQTLKPAAQEDGKVVGPTHRSSLQFQEIFLVLISVRRWVDPKDRVWPEGVDQWKISITLPRIKPATFDIASTKYAIA
jgi:hypothetical protein